MTTLNYYKFKRVAAAQDLYVYINGKLTEPANVIKDGYPELVEK